MDFDVISAQVQRTLRSVKNTGCASLTQMGGLPRLKVRGINQRRGMGQRPMALSKANAILDGFWAAFSRFLLGDIILPLLTSHVFLKN